MFLSERIIQVEDQFGRLEERKEAQNFKPVCGDGTFKLNPVDSIDLVRPGLRRDDQQNCSKIATDLYEKQCDQGSLVQEPSIASFFSKLRVNKGFCEDFVEQRRISDERREVKMIIDSLVSKDSSDSDSLEDAAYKCLIKPAAYSKGLPVKIKKPINRDEPSFEFRKEPKKGQ